jgi:hypothetical protein
MASKSVTSVMPKICELAHPPPPTVTPYSEISALFVRIREWSRGIGDIEGKAAKGSGERAGEASEFQIRVFTRLRLKEATAGQAVAFPRRVFEKRDRHAKDPRSDRA